MKDPPSQCVVRVATWIALTLSCVALLLAAVVALLALWWWISARMGG